MATREHVQEVGRQMAPHLGTGALTFTLACCVSGAPVAWSLLAGFVTFQLCVFAAALGASLEDPEP